MQELINWTKSPIVVADENGDRIVIKPGRSRPVAGDFKNHPWVKKGRLEIAEGNRSDTGNADESEELKQLREQYRSIFGKEPHGNASPKTLRQKIDEWRNEQE